MVCNFLRSGFLFYFFCLLLISCSGSGEKFSSVTGKINTTAQISKKDQEVIKKKAIKELKNDFKDQPEYKVEKSEIANLQNDGILSKVESEKLSQLLINE